MPVNSTHPQYDANLLLWQRCRDAFLGEDDIKLAGEKYLPKPGGFQGGEYAHYVTRSSYYEAVNRTISGFVGAVARKDPTIVVPTELEVLVDDATADGLSLNELIKRLCCEAILQGRVGVLVDYDDKASRCYLVPYMVEAITNWSDDQVILNETVYEQDPEDHFKVLAIEQYRQLWMKEGAYTVTVWRKKKRGDNDQPEWMVHTEVVPKRVGKPLETLPWFWLTPMGKTAAVSRPPLLGLVNICISHYRDSADLSWGRHLTGLPTAYICSTSMNPDIQIALGSSSAIIIQDSTASVGFLEFKGQGLGSLENALAEKEQKMAVLGASVFTEDKKGVEAAETAKIRTSGETNLLSGVVTSVEETVQAALECAAEWMGVDGEIEVTLSRDFVEQTLDGPALTGLVAAFQAGALSLPQFLYNLSQAELLKPETDLDEEEALLLATKAAATKAASDETIRVAKATKPAGGA